MRQRNFRRQDVLIYVAPLEMYSVTSITVAKVVLVLLSFTLEILSPIVTSFAFLKEIIFDVTQHRLCDYNHLDF